MEITRFAAPHSLRLSAWNTAFTGAGNAGWLNPKSTQLEGVFATLH
jgi:hypothetical protein